MKSSVRVCLGLIVFSSVFAFVGCGDDDDGSDGPVGGKAQGGDASGGAGAGAEKCEEIAHLCHPVDDGDGPLHECHEQSEVGNVAKCAEIYASCIAQCQAAHDALTGGAGGAGGVGGVSSGGAAAGGVAAGGVSAGGAAAGASAAGTAGSAE